LVDTLKLAESPQLDFFNEANSERVARQKAAPLTVIIGNPPYNSRQRNENDNNKNRSYAVIDSRISETYVKDSKAILNMQLYDAYIKFFRWAVDRLAEQDGIICFVSNNSFLEGITFDGLRKHLLQDFTQIYHLNLGGNARKDGGGSVFGIMVGVGITILVRKRAKIAEAPAKAMLFYHALPNQLTGAAKLALLTKLQSVEEIAWQVLQPDAKNNWLTEGIQPEFEVFLPLGTKEAKAAAQPKALFKTYSNGVKTNEDAYVYNFDGKMLRRIAQGMVVNYHVEQQRWFQQGQPKDLERFLQVDEQVLKWNRRTKRSLLRGIKVLFAPSKIRRALYRPFAQQNYYFEQVFNEDVYQFPSFFPTPASEAENLIICLTGVGVEKPFTCLITNVIPNLGLAGGFGCPTQCFPLYTYAEDGRKRQENITDWAVKQFEAQYGVFEGDFSAKKAIFFYIYALLHHPLYRERYQENLKRELPRLPLVGNRQTFLTLVDIGQKLADLHLNYETVEEYPLEWVENKHVPWTWRVEKMKLTKEKDSIIVNRCLTLKGIPASAFDYQLGNRSALEWIIDQYQITTDKRSGITNDPNRGDDQQYIVHLIGKVITVSVETVKLVTLLNNISLDSA
jgi:predicted helicase